MGKRPHVVFATIGSLGDLHPCLALGVELQQRGFVTTVCSTEFYRAKVEATGVSFRPIRPNWNPTDQDLIRQCEELRTGPEVLFRKLILPHLRDTYCDLLSACSDADAMIAGELVYAAPLVSEKLGLRWVSLILSPSSFFSSHDPSVLVTVPGLVHLRKAGWRTYRLGLNVCRLATRHWSNPVRRLRREMKLRPDCDPVFRDKFAPDLVLAAFSRCLAQPQPDWPQQTVQTGFVYYDQEELHANDSIVLARFLASGTPPVVFTLGSTAVHHPGNFYESSASAARQLGQRAVLLGTRPDQSFAGADILTLPYAPYSKIFRAAAVIVHQGGAGTTAQALKAGKPMLFVPYGWDQPDNAARAKRLGVALHLSRNRYSAASAAKTLNLLLRDSHFASRAFDIGKQLQREDGLSLCCDAIESVLRSSNSSTGRSFPGF